MKPSFYEYAIRYKEEGARDPQSRLANTIHQDIAFPKQAESFNELSEYIEHNPLYANLATVFDDMWQDYSFEHL